MIETIKTITGVVEGLEARRKANPSEFFSAPGKPHLDCDGFRETTNMLGHLESLVSRLKAMI